MYQNLERENTDPLINLVPLLVIVMVAILRLQNIAWRKRNDIGVGNDPQTNENLGLSKKGYR